MEYTIGSEKFQYYVESLQTTQSPEDILEQVEEDTGESLQNIDEDELQNRIDITTRRVIGW